MKTIFLNAGHSLNTAGAVHDTHDETVLSIDVRNALLPLLRKAGFKVESVPDDIDLYHSIKWVNLRANEDDFALSIHFNYLSDPRVRGTECFYWVGKKGDNLRAGILSKSVSEALTIPNRKAKKDTQTFVGELGWLRKTTCSAVLVEVCFLTNRLDMIHYNPHLAAEGIVNGLKDIFEKDLSKERKNDVQIKINLLKQIIELLRKLLFWKSKSR